MIIKPFHSRDRLLCNCIETKESFYIKKSLNSHRINCFGTWRMRRHVKTFFSHLTGSVLCRIALWGCFSGWVLTQFSTQVKEVTASPTDSHSAILHMTDPVSAHTQAQNRPRPLAFSSPEPVVSWSRGLRYKLSRVALGTRMVPWVLEGEPWERGCLGMAKTKSKKGDDYL